jgi:hypothetical protein
MITRPNELSSVLALCLNCSKFGHIMLWLIHRLAQSIVSDEKNKLGGFAGHRIPLPAVSSPTHLNHGTGTCTWLRFGA